MSRAVLILHSSEEEAASLRQTYARQGNLVTTVNSIRQAESVLDRFRPAVVIVEAGLLVDGWQSKASALASTVETSEWVYLREDGSARTNGGSGPISGHWQGPPSNGHSSNGGQREAARAAGGRPENPRVRYPLRLKITVPYVVLAVLIALSGAYIVTRLIFDTIEERFTNQLIEAGKIAAESIVRLENEHLEALRLMLHSEGLAESLEQRDVERLRAITLPLAINSSLDSVVVLDRYGESLLTLRHRKGGRAEDYEAVRGETVYRQWTFVRRTILGESDEQGDKWAGLAHASWGDYIFFGAPLRSDRGEPIGVVMVGASADEIAQGLRAATGGQASLYRLDGSLLATTLVDPPVPLENTMADQLLALQDGRSLQRDLRVANIDYREIVGPLEVRNGVDLGIVGTALPRDFLVQASLVTRVQVFGFVSVAFMLVIGIGLVVSGRMTRPLLHLVRASIKVARGDFSVRVPSGGNDEVSYLASSFNQMVGALEESNRELQSAYAQTLVAYEKTIEGWSKALELRDEDTEGHTQRVTEMTVRLAKELGVGDEEIVHMRRGALLHDIGKMAVPDDILNKPGKLNDSEWEVMRKHPIYAMEMLSPITYLEPSLDIPRYHHERWDGTGYPEGLRGEEIPLAARIFAIVDVWDALSSDRPYRKAWPKEKVVDHLRGGKGSHFDPQIVEVFLGVILRGQGYGLGIARDGPSAKTGPLVGSSARGSG